MNQIADRPEASVWLDIPNSCHMRGEFTGDFAVQVMFGDPRDGVNVLFERRALERFVQLAQELLAIPVPDDPRIDLPKLYAPAATHLVTREREGDLGPLSPNCQRP